MAVTAKWYASAMVTAFNKEWDFQGTPGSTDSLGDSIKVLLTTSTYTPNQSTNKYKDVVTAIGTNEVTGGSGYTTGGATLLNKTNTNASGLTTTLDADDTIWTSATISNARYAVIYDDTPASNKPLLCYVDFATNQSSAGGDFQLVWNASGIATVVVS